MNRRPLQIARRVRAALALTLALAGLAASAGQPAAAQQPSPAKLPAPVLSLTPGELLKLLPPTPEGWKLASSSASNELTTAPGTKTFAARDYVSTAPPATTPAGSPPPPPAKTRVVLIDTGFDPTALTGFADFKAEVLPGEKNTRRFLWDGHPAVLVTRASGKQVLTLNLALRFVAIVEAENQPETALKEWVDRLDLPALTQAAVSLPRNPLPARTVQLVRIDELNPQANSTRLQSYVTEEEAAAYRKVIDGKPGVRPAGSP